MRSSAGRPHRIRIPKGPRFVVEVDESGPYVLDTTLHGEDEGLLVYLGKDPIERTLAADEIARALNVWWAKHQRVPTTPTLLEVH